MAAITRAQARVVRTRLAALRPSRAVVSGVLAVAVWYFSRQNLWLLGAFAVAAVELWPGISQPRRTVVDRLTPLAVGVAVAVIISLVPKALSQLALAAGYGLWRYLQSHIKADQPVALSNLLVVQAVLFEAIFLAAGVWHLSSLVVLILVWPAAYVPVVTLLGSRREPAAGLLAAAWALVAVEVSWVCLIWLVSYVVPNSYLIVPQPALILTTMAYSFGSIYTTQRHGHLTRTRLAEYLLIGLVILAIVVAGTPWRGLS